MPLKPYDDIPGTPVYDGARVQQGFHLNQFCMSLMQAANRERFLADEAAYLDEWPISDAQKQAVIARDMTTLVALGGNIYYLVKIAATDGKSVVACVSSMTDMSETEYRAMMVNGGRSPEGNRYTEEQD